MWRPHSRCKQQNQTEVGSSNTPCGLFLHRTTTYPLGCFLLWTNNKQTHPSGWLWWTEQIKTSTPSWVVCIENKQTNRTLVGLRWWSETRQPNTPFGVGCGTKPNRQQPIKSVSPHESLLKTCFNRVYFHENHTNKILVGFILRR